MFKLQLTIPGFALLAILGTSPAARAATIDTFSFTQGDWSDFFQGTGTLAPITNGILTGSFTGIVEPGGFIELTDLSSLTVAFTSPHLSTEEILASTTLFSYDTNGGASSLDIAGPQGLPTICVGAAATLAAGCTLGFHETFPVGTKGDVEFGGAFLVSPDLPVITLESSVTTNPAVTPEPQSTVFVSLALVALVLMHSRRKTRRTL